MAKGVSKPVPTGKLVLEDKQLIKWLSTKEDLVKEGRDISKEIVKLEKEIDAMGEKEQELTGSVKPTELIKQGDELKDQINALVQELEKVSKAIYEAKLAAIPDTMRDKHLKLNKQKEELEQKRNKVALKVQKIKDRAIPRLQKLTDGFLGEFEDLLTAELKAGKVVVEKFNHRDDWEKQWKERNFRKKR